MPPRITTKSLVKRLNLHADILEERIVGRNLR